MEKSKRTKQHTVFLLFGNARKILGEATRMKKRICLFTQVCLEFDTAGGPAKKDNNNNTNTNTNTNNNNNNK